MRLSPISLAAGKRLDFAAGDTEQKHALGTRTGFVSYDYSTTAGVPNAGGGEAIYVKAAGTFIPGRLVHIDKDWNILDMPNTPGTGRPVYVCLSDFSATNCYGWVAAAGVVPVSFSVAATAGLVFFGAAGQASPTQANGKQILGATTLIAAAATFTKSVKTNNGSKRLEMNDVSGCYPGLAVSGTGIAGGSTIASIDPGGRFVTLSANMTATAVVTGTFTHTGYGIVHIEHPFVQGQIL